MRYIALLICLVERFIFAGKKEVEFAENVQELLPEKQGDGQAPRLFGEPPNFGPPSLGNVESKVMYVYDTTRTPFFRSWPNISRRVHSGVAPSMIGRWLSDSMRHNRHW